MFAPLPFVTQRSIDSDTLQNTADEMIVRFKTLYGKVS